MKRLPPTLREKTRYLNFKIYSEDDIELGEFVDEVWNACLSYIGSKGCSEANFWVIGNLFDKKRQEGIIRFNKGSEEDIRAALSLINTFNNKKGFVAIQKTSGTVKDLERV